MKTISEPIKNSAVFVLTQVNTINFYYWNTTIRVFLVITIDLVVISTDHRRGWYWTISTTNIVTFIIIPFQKWLYGCLDEAYIKQCWVVVLFNKLSRVAQWVRLMDYITTHTSLSPIRRGNAPGLVNYNKQLCQEHMVRPSSTFIQYL